MALNYLPCTPDSCHYICVSSATLMAPSHISFRSFGSTLNFFLKFFPLYIRDIIQSISFILSLQGSHDILRSHTDPLRQKTSLSYLPASLLYFVRINYWPPPPTSTLIKKTPLFHYPPPSNKSWHYFSSFQYLKSVSHTSPRAYPSSLLLIAYPLIAYFDITHSQQNLNTYVEICLFRHLPKETYICSYWIQFAFAPRLLWILMGV